METLRDIQDYIFSPLDKSHCIYFYVLMVMSFVSLLFNITSLVWVSIKSKRVKLLWQRTILTLVTGILLYHHNRLFYSICMR